jgi:hypothetical protein
MILELPRFNKKPPGSMANKGTKKEYLNHAQEAEKKLSRLVDLFSDAVSALDALVDCQVETVALEASSSSLVPSASSELFQTKIEELKKNKIYVYRYSKGNCG